MLQDSAAFGGFSVNDLAKAKDFYGTRLGLKVEENEMGMLHITFSGGGEFIIYPKDDHLASTYTVLNFPVEDIDATVDDLAGKGVMFEHYEGMTDDKGVARGIAAKRGPDIAWFKDPAGNILSVLHNA
jgi:predicted enzyme related to lactoylglutathione lyase